MVNSFSFDIVLPCFNPHSSWDEVVFEHYKELKDIYGDQFKALIIVNDGSAITPNSRLLQKKVAGLIWIDYPENQGKGFAVRKGVAKSSADFCFYTDLDFPFGIHPLEVAYLKLSNGVDVVLGRRDESYYKKLPIMRWIISKITNLMNRWILRLPYDDTQAGMKGFNQNGRALLLKTTINTFLFDTEFILRSFSEKSKIEIVPLVPREGVFFSVMKGKVLLKEVINFSLLLLKT